MKVREKIHDFFSAMAPIFTYYIVSITGALFCTIFIFINGMRSNITLISSSTIPAKEIYISRIIITLFCFIAVIIEIKTNKLKFSDISPVKQNIKVYFAVIILAVGTFFTAKFINSLFIHIAGISTSESASDESEYKLVLMFINSLILPITEELVFRGLTVKKFENKFPALFTAAVTTIFFAAIRLSMNIMCYAVLLSVMLIFIRYKFGDLKLCILTHIIVSILFLFSNYIFAAYYDSVKNIGGVIGIAATAAALFCMIKFASKPEGANSPSIETD